MPYDAEISRNNPAAFIFLLDQSSSMNETLHGTRKTLASFLANCVNEALRELVNQCTRGDESVRDYFHVAALSYSDGAVKSVWTDTDAFFHPISTIADSPARLEVTTFKYPDEFGITRIEQVESEVWFEAAAVGDTPMVQALEKTRDIVKAWVKEHPASFPPIVFHVTDGEPTDSDPEPAAMEIKAITTWDGACLLFNLHVSRDPAAEVIFPATEEQLPDDYAKKLFRMSSVIPAPLRPAAQEAYPIAPASRFFGFKAGAETITKFFQIGTRPANAPVVQPTGTTVAEPVSTASGTAPAMAPVGAAPAETPPA
ncbi:MAG: VWA domain-containing protein [Rhodoplanes sp.]|uniref:vWA domain-containing protein n=1 Tax=Rhodoplanes sp. TaxID=1968906 RepID=UPI0017BA1CF2|nr:vWA domain-containing protein [Rhodoplanes sp.]NVO13600.1 VWA domain-containing protein [Rhodoplanes sp.]